MGTRITLPFMVKPVGIGYYVNGELCYDQFDVVVGGGVQLPTVDVVVKGGNLSLTDAQCERISDRLQAVANEELLTAVLRETVRCQTVLDKIPSPTIDPERTVKSARASVGIPDAEDYR